MRRWGVECLFAEIREPAPAKRCGQNLCGDRGQRRAGAGYYTISAGAVDFDTVPENLPRHPIPVVLIGRLAVDIGARGRGLGETLLIHALESAQRVAEIAGVFAVVVDALDKQAKSFYLKYGFKELADDQLHLYLAIRTINKLKL